MAEVHIRNLKCVQRQDPVGRDSAYLTINGRTVAGPYSMAKGDNVWVNVKEPFTDDVRVTLMEADAGPDDDLGHVDIGDGLVGDGILEGNFNGKTHALYTMTYDVHG